MTAAHATARAVHLPNGTLAITFPYRAWLVDDLKRMIPSNCRSYDPDSRTWIISGELASLAIEILTIEFGEVDVERGSSRSQSGPTPIKTSDADYKALHLLPSAPAELVRSAYRCMARLHHPDAGGATPTMQAVNAAYESLRKVGAA